MNQVSRIDRALEISIKWTLELQSKQGGFPFSSFDRSTIGLWASSQAVCAILSSNEKYYQEITKSLNWLKEESEEFLSEPMERNNRLLESNLWAILALSMANLIENKYMDITKKSLVKTINYVNNDGGWGSWKGDRSRIVVTSNVVSLIKFCIENDVVLEKETSTFLNNGVEYIVRSQNIDGGWGFRRSEPSNSIATSYALIALSGLQVSSDVLTRGLEWLETEKRKYYFAKKNFFMQESIWRDNNIQRWSYFAYPLMIYAFVTNDRSIEAYKDLRQLLAMQKLDGSWVDPREDYLAFHTYVTIYLLSNIKRRIDEDKFERYCDALDQIQKEEHQSLLISSKNKLKIRILENGLKKTKDEFTLSSGKKSKYYYDLKKVLLDPPSITIIGEIIWELIKYDEIDAIGGQESGAIPISVSVVRESYNSDRNLRAFFVRKEPKKYGTQLWIEGNISRGDKVVVVEDVVTTGGSIMKTIEKLKENNCEILKIICIVDREEGAEEKFKEMGIEFNSLFKHSDFEVII